jgi:hypothetical protein
MGDFVKGDLVLYVYAGIAALGLLSLAFGVIGAVLARRRGRSAVVWGLLCFLFSLFAIILLLCLRKVHQHPVWARPADAAVAARESPATASERDTPTHRPPSGNGKAPHGGTPFASEPADQTIASTGMRFAGVRPQALDHAPLEAPPRASATPVPEFTLVEDPDNASTTPAAELVLSDEMLSDEMLSDEMLSGEMLSGEMLSGEMLSDEVVSDEPDIASAPEVALGKDLDSTSAAPVRQVTPSENPTSTLATPAAEVKPTQIPRSTPATPAPRRVRVAGVPAGYPEFQLMARGDIKIEVRCPNCSYIFRRLNSMRGKLEKCPECRAVMRIPT